MFEGLGLAEVGLARTLLGIVIAVGLAYVVAGLAGHLVRPWLVAVFRDDKIAQKDAAVAEAEVHGPVRIVRWIVFIGLATTIVMPMVRLVGVNTELGLAPETLLAWLFGPGIRIVIIAAVAYLAVRVIAAASRRLEAYVVRDAGPDVAGHARRARTLSRLVQSTLTTVVVTLATLIILRELNMDITPLLAGAGIFGLAVGFGAQALVRDLISGFFLIVEDQIRVGDLAVINGTTGVVEAINLRIVVLRDLEGTVHIFPNGAITQLANRSKDYSVYVTDLDVSDRHDPDEVMARLHAVGDELAADAEFGRLILQPLQIPGVDSVRESRMTIRIMIRTVPQQHMVVGRELLRRIKKDFDAAGIANAERRMTISVSESGRPLLRKAE